MKIFALFLLGSFIAVDAFADDTNIVNQSLLFDDADIIVRAPTQNTETPQIDDDIKARAVKSAKELLRQPPRRIPLPNMPNFKSATTNNSSNTSHPTTIAPFGLLWNSNIGSTREQGIKLNLVELKDYPNSYEAFNLPKPVDFFEHIFVTYGPQDKLYRILAYSKFLDDDATASLALRHYNTYSEYLNKKYGNMKQEFIPATITHTELDENEKEITVEETAPIGNPDFLAQLAAGTAVLYSTYHNEQVEATLSIGVDGEQKSYIVIEYRNLQILKQQEDTTIDAL